MKDTKSILQVAFDMGTDQYLKSKTTNTLKNELFEMAPFVDMYRLIKLASKNIIEASNSTDMSKALNYIYRNSDFKDWNIEIVANFAYLSTNSHFNTIRDKASERLNNFIDLKKKESTNYSKTLITKC